MLRLMMRNLYVSAYNAEQYKTRKEAIDANERIREALLQGKAYLEL